MKPSAVGSAEVESVKMPVFCGWISAMKPSAVGSAEVLLVVCPVGVLTKMPLP